MTRVKPILRGRIGIWLAVTVAVVCGIYFAWRIALPSLTAMTHSYPAYYTASRLVLDGRWSPQIYDNDWFGARVLEMTQGLVSDRFSLHPPTTSLLLVPIAWLDLTTARVLWQVFNLGLLAFALWFLLDAFQLTQTVWRAFFLAFVFVYPPLAENIRVGQTYVLVLFLFALAYWNELRGNHFGTGIGLGLAAGLKLSGSPIWLVLAVRSQWRALFWAVVVGAVSALLGLAVLGWQGWVAFFQQLVLSFHPPSLVAHVSFQTTPSFFQRMFVSSPDFNPTPLLDAPALAPIFNLVFTALALVSTLWFARRADIAVAFAAAVTLSVILFPMALEYHYTLLLIPLACAFSKLTITRTRSDVVWFTLILLLLCVPFNWNAPRWSTREMMLFAYPRLYGGWLLWLWLLKQISLPSKARVALPSGATP